MDARPKSVQMSALGPNHLPLPRLGRYQLISPLAVGTTAELFLARQGDLAGFRTPVVIKKLLPELAAHPRFVALFLEEARIAAMLDHPNVVKVFEVGRSGDEYFLAMELFQSKPLASLVRRAVERKEALNQRLAALAVAHAAAGLHHAHALCDAEGRPMGLVHRDLSPQKILVSFEGAVKVIDFGVASVLEQMGDTQTGRGATRTAYMAPEQARGEAVDHRADIFSLGAILWEAVTGRRLFDRPRDIDTVHAILHEPVRPPSTVAPVPAPLEAIIMRALSKAPAARFRSAHEMAAALELHVSRTGGGGTRDLAALMKTYFGEDQIQWRQTVRVALDMEAPADAAELGDVHLSHTGIHTLPASAAAQPALAAGLPGGRLVPLTIAALVVVICAAGFVLLRRRPVAEVASPPPASEESVPPLAAPARRGYPGAQWSPTGANEPPPETAPASAPAAAPAPGHKPPRSPRAPRSPSDNSTSPNGATKSARRPNPF